MLSDFFQAIYGIRLDRIANRLRLIQLIHVKVSFFQWNLQSRSILASYIRFKKIGDTNWTTMRMTRLTVFERIECQQEINEILDWNSRWHPFVREKIGTERNGISRLTRSTCCIICPRCWKKKKILRRSFENEYTKNVLLFFSLFLIIEK